MIDYSFGINMRAIVAYFVGVAVNFAGVSNLARSQIHEQQSDDLSVSSYKISA
jgi:cytosine/uracil/thiamine/allantoin permease